MHNKLPMKLLEISRTYFEWPFVKITLFVVFFPYWFLKPNLVVLTFKRHESKFHDDLMFGLKISDFNEAAFV